MTRTETTTFGPVLRQFRLAAGLTQEELAERCGLSVRGISDLERGVNVRPRRDTIELLVQALSLTGPDRLALEEAARVPKSAVEVLDQGDNAYIPFVGREDERRAFADFLDGRGPPALLIAGEPGIGKTRLLQEAMAMAATAGKAVLIGGCQRRGGQEPFTPISDAISRYLTRLPPSRQRAV